MATNEQESSYETSKSNLREKEKTHVKGKSNLTEERIRTLMGTQKNAVKQNDREGEETALDHALKGSKIYLKAQGFLSEEEGGNHT